MAKKNIIYAKDCQCCVCGKQADALWPTIDPDIPAHPYCRECLDKVKEETLLKLLEIDEKYNKKQEKKNNNSFPKGC